MIYLINMVSVLIIAQDTMYVVVYLACVKYRSEYLTRIELSADAICARCFE